jgi:hypothetical protein
VNIGYIEAVYRNGELHAQFRNKGEAAKFIDRDARTPDEMKPPGFTAR